MLALTAASCTSDSDDTQGGVDDRGTHFVIPFTATINGEPVECGRSYEGVGSSSSSVEVRDVRFYVHDVQLVTADGDRVPLQLDEDHQFQKSYTRADGSESGIALLDFTDTSSELCADRGTSDLHTFISGHAPEGDYTGVEFTVGVPEEENHVNGAVSDAPLNAYGMQWTWASGYRHMKLEVQATTGDKVKDKYYFHPGSQGCESTNGEVSGPYACSMPLLATVTMDLSLDAEAIEFDLGRFYAADDLDRGRGCMFVRNLSDMQDGEEVDPNGCSEMFAAIGIELPEFDGEGTPTTDAGQTSQTAFRAIPFDGEPGEPADFPDVQQLDRTDPQGWPHPDYERDPGLDLETMSGADLSFSHAPGDARYGANCMKCHQSHGPGPGQFVIGGTVYDAEGGTYREGGMIELGLGEGNRFAQTVEEKITNWEPKFQLPIDANGQFYATAVPELDYGVENYMAKVYDAAGQLKLAMSISPHGACNHCHSTGFQIRLGAE